MGLDMYARTTRARIDADADFEEPEDAAEIHCWRKHPNLHGWMEALYRERGGLDDSFNLATLRLTAEDLDRLELALVGGRLPETSGFFFGRSDGTETDDDLAFVKKARAALARGLTVYYKAWF